jgi:hypothetical protein
MNTIHRQIPVALRSAALCAAALLCCAPVRVRRSPAAARTLQAYFGRNAVYLPARTLHRYHTDNTRPVADTVHPDSFLLRAIDSLVLASAAPWFTVAVCGAEGCGNGVADPPTGFSPLAGDTADSAVAVERIVAAGAGAEVVLVPYDCTVRHSAFRRRGWRDDKFGGAYRQPVTVTATVTFHLQVWDAGGTLIAERAGTAEASRAWFYTALRKRRSEEQAITVLAPRIYASEILRGLHKAITAVFQFDKQYADDPSYENIAAADDRILQGPLYERKLAGIVIGYRP